MAVVEIAKCSVRTQSESKQSDMKSKAKKDNNGKRTKEFRSLSHEVKFPWPPQEATEAEIRAAVKFAISQDAPRPL